MFVIFGVKDKENRGVDKGKWQEVDLFSPVASYFSIHKFYEHHG
jgi:hypothetical protein